jgi:hypothetical protein
VLRMRPPQTMILETGTKNCFCDKRQGWKTVSTTLVKCPSLVSVFDQTCAAVMTLDKILQHNL